MNKRKGRLRHSFFIKYLAFTFAMIFVCFGVLGSFLLVFVSRYWAEEKSAVLTETASSFASSMSELLSAGRIDMNTENSIVTLCSSISLISDSIDADVFVCDIYGNVLLCRDIVSRGNVVIRDGYCEKHSKLIIPEAVIKSASQKSYIHVGNMNGALGENCFVSGEPVKVGSKTFAVVFAMAPTVTGLIPYVFTIFEMFFISAALALVIAFIGTYFLTYSMTKPLRQMVNATQAYSKGDFSFRVPVRHRDELGVLAENFNSMAHDLALLESSRRSFVANVSHELKTPMTTIAGFIDGMLDGTIPPEKRMHYLSVVSDEIKRLSRLVSSMLNISKIEAGQLELSFVGVDIESLMFKTFIAFEQKIEQKNINVVGLDAVGEITARADRDMLLQVVYNLVDNAVKFTPEGGTISVSASHGNGTVTVRIRNTGVGIPSEEIDRIFERFYKIDKSRSFDTKSTGLGLFIVKSILEMHNGRIYASSVENEYTEFVFELPEWTS